MALIAFFESTSQTVSNTEFSFPSDSTTRVAQTATGEFYVLIDVANMIAGDQFRLRLYEKIGGSGATQRVIYEESPTGLQPRNIVWGPVALRNGWDVTGLRVLGADRVIPISIFQVTSDVNVTSIASDVITSDAVAASAVTEIQTGIASSSALATAQTDLTTLTGRLTPGRAANLDHLDADLTSRAAAATALSTDQWTNARAVLVDNLDAAVSSRASAADVTTAIAAAVATIASAAATAVWTFAHQPGRTVKGALKRLDQLLTGKHTGMSGAVWTMYDADGTTPLVQANQNASAGTRDAATTIAGD